MSAVAPQILHENVGRIWFRRKAIITNIDTGVCYGQSIYIQGIEAVSILG
jgi:hypothetical protein